MKLNTVFKNELRLNARTMKIAWLVFVVNFILTFFSSYLFFNIVNRAKSVGSIDYPETLNAYLLLTAIEFIILLVVLPAFTASSISGEREKQTLDILLASKLTPLQIVFGKLEACLGIVCILSISSLPALSIIFAFGGISILDLTIFLLIMLVSAIFIGSIGIFFSSFFKKTTAATMASYGVLLLITLGTLVIIYIIYSALDSKTLYNYMYKADLGAALYILLINPAINFLGMITQQVGNGKELLLQFNRLGDYNNDFIVKNWTIISFMIQMLLSFVMLAAAARCVNPLQRKHKK